MMLFRKRWTNLVIIAAAVALLVGGVTYWRSHHRRQLAASPAPSNPQAALAELRAGNARFVNSARTLSTDTDHDAELRHTIAREQHPFAAILCCSDSRVCPEFVFDQRAGSIFEIRNAGNVVDEDVMASMEYAVEHLHVPLILVLGHKHCGAVEAVCEAGDKALSGHLQELQKHMSAIRQRIHDNPNPHDPKLLDSLCKENARQQALLLLSDSHVLRTAVEKDTVRLLCGIYDMETGEVDFFEAQ